MRNLKCRVDWTMRGNNIIYSFELWIKPISIMQRRYNWIYTWLIFILRNLRLILLLLLSLKTRINKRFRLLNKLSRWTFKERSRFLLYKLLRFKGGVFYFNLFNRIVRNIFGLFFILALILLTRRLSWHWKSFLIIFSLKRVYLLVRSKPLRL